MNKSLAKADHEITHYYYRQRIISINTFKILFYMTKMKRPVYFSEIKKYLNRSCSQISQTMKRLTLKGYVEINNRHPLKYIITKSGIKIYKQTVKGFLKYKHITRKVTYESISNNKDLLKDSEEEDYYRGILIGFFIELPEILLALNINFTPEKYHRFVGEIKDYLLKYDIVL
jgi:hypothetical protein